MNIIINKKISFKEYITSVIQIVVDDTTLRSVIKDSFTESNSSNKYRFEIPPNNTEWFLYLVDIINYLYGIEEFKDNLMISFTKDAKGIYMGLYFRAGSPEEIEIK